VQPRRSETIVDKQQELEWLSGSDDFAAAVLDVDKNTRLDDDENLEPQQPHTHTINNDDDDDNTNDDEDDEQARQDLLTLLLDGDGDVLSHQHRLHARCASPSELSNTRVQLAAARRESIESKTELRHARSAGERAEEQHTTATVAAEADNARLQGVATQTQQALSTANRKLGDVADELVAANRRIDTLTALLEERRVATTDAMAVTSAQREAQLEASIARCVRAETRVEQSGADNAALLARVAETDARCADFKSLLRQASASLDDKRAAAVAAATAAKAATQSAVDAHAQDSKRWQVVLAALQADLRREKAAAAATAAAAEQATAAATATAMADQEAAVMEVANEAGAAVQAAVDRERTTAIRVAQEAATTTATAAAEAAAAVRREKRSTLNRHLAAVSRLRNSHDEELQRRDAHLIRLTVRKSAVNVRTCMQM
jgi:hypothetical protein